MLDQKVRIPDRYHFVKDAIHNERRLRDLLELSKPFACYLFPFTERCYLRLRDSGAGRRLAVGFALHQSFDKGSSFGLAGFGRCEKYLLQYLIAFEIWILQM